MLGSHLAPDGKAYAINFYLNAYAAQVSYASARVLFLNYINDLSSAMPSSRALS